jgi:hypothetical protein
VESEGAADEAVLNTQHRRRKKDLGTDLETGIPHWQHKGLQADRLTGQHLDKEY